MSIIFVLNRLDALINRVERLTAAVSKALGIKIEELPPTVEVTTISPELVVSQPQLPNRYKIFQVDLTTAHTDAPLGIGIMLKDVSATYASYMSIITVPSAFTFKLNSTDMDAIDASVGLEWSDFEITEIFVTNAALAGTALINVEYRVD